MSQILRTDRRRFVLFEVGLLIILTMLFMYGLTAVTITSRTVILSTEHLMKSIVRVHVVDNVYEYDVQSIATIEGGRMYISLGHSNMIGAEIVLPITFAQLVERGFNNIELDVTVVGDENSKRFSVYIAPHLLGNAFNLGSTDSGNITLKMNIDTTAFAVYTHTAIVPSYNVVLCMLLHDVAYVEYIVLSVKIYTVSERPVFKALMEPIFSAFAALYAVFLAVIRRVKEYVLSAFGGFVGHFTLTGLIGDPVIALILVIIFVTIVFIVIRKRR